MKVPKIGPGGQGRFSGYAREQLERFCEILRGKIETVEIRGVD